MRHIIIVSLLLALTACQSTHLNTDKNSERVTSQTEQMQYSADIKNGEFSAHITSVPDGMNGYLLQIQPSSPNNVAATKSTPVIKKHIDDPVIKAQMTDLNQDGYPEVLVFTQSVGSGSYGNVIAYSSHSSDNSGLSWREVSFPELSDTLAQGYMGHDAFVIKDSTLTRQFPIYLDDDTNADPQGGMRYIVYHLQDNEAARQFVVDKVLEDK